MSDAYVVYNIRHLEPKQKFQENQENLHSVKVPKSDEIVFKDEDDPDVTSTEVVVKIEPKTEDLEEDFKISTAYAESKPHAVVCMPDNLLKPEPAESVEDVPATQISAGGTAGPVTGITEDAAISTDWNAPNVKIERQTELEEDLNIGTIEPHSRQTDDCNAGEKSVDIEDSSSGTFLLLTSEVDKRKLWGVRCEVLSCRTSKREDPTLKFFKFPPPGADLYEKWILACGLEKTTQIRNAYVCSKHFYESDMGKKRLRKNVFPSKSVHDKGGNAANISVLLSGKAFKEAQNMEWDDLTFEELQALDPHCASTSGVELAELTCKNCINLKKSIGFYRQKYTSLLKKYTDLKKIYTSAAAKKRLYLFRSKEQKKKFYNCEK